jgi:LPXTG-motif cell wall-anchored protein
MKTRNGWTRLLLVLGVVGVSMALALSVSAQVQTQTNTTSDQAAKEVKVERAEVVYVNGNDLVLKMDDGTTRHIGNVPESARATVDGKEIGIHDVKVGMKLQKTITTTTTPKLVTTVQSVTGKVWHVTPPSSVILTLDDGTNQRFNIPKDQKFNVDGQMTDAWGLKKGMKISATKVVEEPVTSVSVKQELSGSMPPPPAPPAGVPVLYAVVMVPRSPAAAAPEEPAALPKTGSSLPLFGLLGALALVSSLGVRVVRRRIV